MGIWIVNGKVIDSSNGQLAATNIFIENGKIMSMVSPESATIDATKHEVIDAQGRLVSAGFIDMHVHLREPGFEHKETIATGTLSAVKGGFTTVACMPNTRPTIDSVEVLQSIYKKAKEADQARVLSYACITKNELGRELTDFEALKAAGAIGFTDDGVGVQSAQMMKDAMTLAKHAGLPIIAHCEDDTLIAGAPVSEGTFSQQHGLKGIPNEAEAIHVGRDILLAEATGVHYHVCHVSAEQSVRLIRQGKQCGINVTAEVCPHHLLLSDEDIPGMDANWKMNPPLRSRRDVEAVIEGLEDGTIDMIVTDHAPHSAEEKARGMMLAPFGIVGFETAFPLLYSKFVLTGRWTLQFLLDRMTIKPAMVFGLPWGKLESGRDADITIIDLDKELSVDPATFVSKSNNTPFAGWKLRGWPVMTLVAGKIVWTNER
jgi:dihydroorotase